MSKMCKMNSSCEATPGICVHEKMMLAMVVLTALGFAAYWLLA
jgi:hypothetical protein